MKTTAKTAFALLAMLAASTLWAVEVTSEQAKIAVGNWITAAPTRIDSTFRSRYAESSKTYKTPLGRAVYHAVNLQGGGFVVTSGDTRLTPIIAFSDTGSFKLDEASPFHALLKKNLSAAVSAFEAADSKAAKSGTSQRAGEAAPTAAESEWASLLSEPKTYATGRKSVSDTRIGIMLKTRWGQDGGYASNGEYLPALDYYVFYPNLPDSTIKRAILPCGCTATAGAQLMYFWKYPTASISQFSSTCTLNGKSFLARSIEGTFDWNNMFETWTYGVDPDPTLTQRKAVGKLAWNLCVALETDWLTANMSGGAGPSYLAAKLKEKFSYKSANYINYDMDMVNKPSDFSSRMADFNNALYASLDAKMPVYLALSGTGSHAVVADGYGYVSGKRYAHLNFGWWEVGNAWYYMDDTDVTPEGTPFTFQAFDGVGFNIHPTATGDVVSGRVLDASGAPVSKATVKLYNTANTLKGTVTTGSKGIFAFRVTAKGSYKIEASHSATTDTATKWVYFDALTKEGSWTYGSARTGNKWGEDVSFLSWTMPVSKKLTLTPNNNNYGSVSGGGTYMAGTVVKLKATAKSGNAFAGWFTDSACKTKLNPSGYDNRDPEVQIAMPSANTTVYAKFVTKAEAKKSLKFTSSTKALATTPKKSMSGYEFSLSLGASSATLVTFSAKGLPYGLKLDPATGKITGTPVKPGYYDVTITVKDAAGNKITQIVKLTLGVLSWSKGDYYGTAYPFGKGDRPGYFTFNVAANGKVSGKVRYKDKLYSFKSECNYSSKLRLLFKPQITIGSKTFSPGYITIAQRTLALGGVVVEEGNDDNGLVLVQRPTGVVTETGQLAELIGQEFVLTKDSNYSPNLLDGDEIVVRVVDGDEVTMRGTINGKTLYGLSAPLRVENYLKRGNGNCYILSAYLFDESLNYYRTIRIQATLFLQWSEERGTYWVLSPSCYIMEEE